MFFGMTATFRGESSGSVALLFGLVVPTLIGFAGLGVDSAYWLMERNKLQAATDTAAISAAQSIALNSTDQAISAEAKKLLVKVYGDKLTGVRFTVQHPPQSGAMKGDATAVSVATEKDQPLFFLGLLGVKNTFVASRAVGHIDSMAESCLLALSPTLDKAIEITGSSTANLGCGIASNSTASDSVYFSGASTTKATSVATVGDVFQSNGAKVTDSGGAYKTHAAAVTDPYGPEGRDLQVPQAPAACTKKNLKLNKTTALSPGRYCGGIDMTGGNITFAPGTYIIDGGNMSANGNVSLSGTGVTFILTGTGAIPLLDINGGANVSLHAPTSGTSTNGVLFFQDPGSASNGGKICHQGVAGESYINGNANLDLSGAMYFPNGYLTMSGGTSNKISCLQVIAQKIKISGNSSITGTCDSSQGTEKMSRSTVELVE
jgi:Flp pilus assembly protein TadG